MKKNISFYKRGISIAVAGILTISSLPSYPLSVAAKSTDKPTLMKAGSVPVSMQNFTKGGPFPKGTAGSDHFRIPALTTLANGEILAVADARYDRISGDGSSPDGGGLDTIASVSGDGGKTWHYSFPIYFPDSNQNAGNKATTIIDPGVIAGPDGTIYCIADVNPTGVTTMGGYRAPGHGTGFVNVNGTERLALTADFAGKAKKRPDKDAEYEYYVGDYEDGYAPVLHMNDDSPSEYCVDDWYNLFRTDNDGTRTELKQTQVDTDQEIQQNVFYEGSELHVYETGYLWMVVSTDYGRTWKNPVILNPQIKRSDDDNDKALLVSPGKGITTHSGTMAIGFYNSKPGREAASIAYSTDNGSTWRRTEDMQTVSGTEIDTSSENEIIELEDGTLRMFFRHGGYQAAVGNLCYVDATLQDDGTYALGTAVQTDISLHKGCNLSALSYSKKIDGRQIVFVSAPSGVRANGVILTLAINADGSMEELHRFAVPGGQGGYGTFVYSCLTELEDGTIGLLWEPSHKEILYDRFQISETGEVSPYSQSSAVDVMLEKEGTHVITDYQGEKNITVEPDADIAKIEFSENSSFAVFDHSGSAVKNSLSSFSTTKNETALLEHAEFTFTGSGTTWTIYNEAEQTYLTNRSSGEPVFEDASSDMTVEKSSEDSDTFRIHNENGTSQGNPADRYLIFYLDQMNFNANTGYNSDTGRFNYELSLLEKDPSATDGFIPGYQKADSIVSGKKYLIAHLVDNKAIVLFPGENWNSMTKLTDPSDVSARTDLIISGIGEGCTQAVIDKTLYDIQVTEEHPDPDPSCNHEETSVKNQRTASCDSDGYTGDTICSQCNAIIEAGSSIPGGHVWDTENAEITAEVTRESDGEKIYTCERDSAHKKTEVIYAYAYSLFLDAYEALQIPLEYASLYENAETLEALRQTAEQILAQKGAARAEFYRVTADLEEAKKSLHIKDFSALKSEFEATLAAAKKEAQEQGGVPDDIWTEFIHACEDADQTIPNDLTDEEKAEIMLQALKPLQDALKEVTDFKDALAFSQAENELSSALSDASALYQAGQNGYSQATWDAFKAAYEAAGNPPEDATVETLRALLKKLLDAKAGLASLPPAGNVPSDNTTCTPPPALKTVIANGITYQVISATEQTAAVTKFENKKAKTLSIPDTINIGGSAYKVVTIRASVFKNCKKLKSVTLGAYVKTIEKQCFTNCKRLSKLKLKGTALTEISSGAFKKTSAKITVNVPKKMKTAQCSKLLKKLKKAGISKKVILK